MSTSNQQAWIKAQRRAVVRYLRRERVDHLGVGDYPAFHVHPYFALWAVQSKKAPGSIGWWAASGDVPIDYISGTRVAHPRAALRAFARKWREVSGYMLRGQEHPNVMIGDPEQWLELGDLLRRRARILRHWVQDEEIWVGRWSELPASPNRRTKSRRGIRVARNRRRSVS